jgi:hypothetical protein
MLGLVVWGRPHTQPGCRGIVAIDPNFARERIVHKHYESSADRIWREKLDACLSPQETIVALLMIAVIAASMWMA